MPFWNRLKAAEAKRASRTDKMLETVSNKTQESGTFDAKIRYLHGGTEAVANADRQTRKAPWIGGDVRVDLIKHATSTSVFEDKIQRAHALEDEKRLQKKIKRDRLEKALQTAAGRLRRESILQCKPNLNAKLLSHTSAKSQSTFKNMSPPRHKDVNNWEENISHLPPRTYFRSEDIVRDYNESQKTVLSEARTAGDNPLDKLEAERKEQKQLRLDKHTQCVESIVRDAYSMATDNTFTKNTNHVDPTGRRHARMYSVTNDIDSDSSSDAEYFSLDNKPAEILRSLESGKTTDFSPLYDSSAAPKYQIDRASLAEIQRNLDRKNEKGKWLQPTPYKVSIDACQAPRQPLIVPQSKGVPTASSELVFKEAVPFHLLVAKNSANTFEAPVTGGRTRPQSVGDHLIFVQKAKSSIKNINPRPDNEKESAPNVAPEPAKIQRPNTVNTVTIPGSCTPKMAKSTATVTASNPPSSIGYVGCDSVMEDVDEGYKTNNGIPQTARAYRLSLSDDFIVPTRPSASSRPPTATRRPQSAGYRRAQRTTNPV